LRSENQNFCDIYFVPGISFKVVGNSDIRSAKALQHGEIIRPFSAKLGFELFVGDNALGDQQLARASVMASVLTISSSRLTLLVFVHPPLSRRSIDMAWVTADTPANEIHPTVPINLRQPFRLAISAHIRRPR